MSCRPAESARSAARTAMARIALTSPAAFQIIAADDVDRIARLSACGIASTHREVDSALWLRAFALSQDRGRDTSISGMFRRCDAGELRPPGRGVIAQVTLDGSVRIYNRARGRRCAARSIRAKSSASDETRRRRICDSRRHYARGIDSRCTSSPGMVSPGEAIRIAQCLPAEVARRGTACRSNQLLRHRPHVDALVRDCEHVVEEAHFRDAGSRGWSRRPRAGA